MKKILVIRFSSIGDIVLTTPVVRSLYNNRPDTEIHYLTKAENLQLLHVNPYITKVWLYRNNFSEIIPALKKENFDHVIDLHRNIRSGYVVSRLGKPSGTFSKINLQKWLMVKAKVNILPDVHIVDRYFQAAADLGIENDRMGLDFFIAPEDEVDISSFPADLSSGYVAFVIGAKHNTKIFPSEKVAEVCNGLNLPVVLLGGPGDEARGEQIKKLCSKLVLNACGKFSISQSASLVRQSAFVISNDTGLMHVAAAFSKPIVSVWGNTIPEFGMFPYYPEFAKPASLISEVNGLSCRPCSKLGYAKCPKGHFKCMKDQDTGRIVEFINGEGRR